MKLALIATLALFAGAVLGVLLTGERSTRLGATIGLVIGTQAADRALATAVRQLRGHARLESASVQWLQERGECAEAVARLTEPESRT